MPAGWILSGVGSPESGRAGEAPRRHALVELAARWKSVLKRALGGAGGTARHRVRQPEPPASRDERPSEGEGPTARREPELRTPVALAASAAELGPAEPAPVPRAPSGEQWLARSEGSPASWDSIAEPGRRGAIASLRGAVPTRPADRPAELGFSPPGPPRDRPHEPSPAPPVPAPGGAEARPAARANATMGSKERLVRGLWTGSGTVRTGTFAATAPLGKDASGLRLGADRLASERILPDTTAAAGPRPSPPIHRPSAEPPTDRAGGIAAPGSEEGSRDVLPARSRMASSPSSPTAVTEAPASSAGERETARDLPKRVPETSPAADPAAGRSEPSGRAERLRAPGGSPAEIHPWPVSFARPRGTRPAPALLDLGPAAGTAGPPGPPPSRPEPAARGLVARPEPPDASTAARPRPWDPPPELRPHRRAARAPGEVGPAVAAPPERAGQAQATRSAVGAPADVPAQGETTRLETIAQAILARARALPASGAIELRFQLLPEDLGPVSVRLESRGRRIRVEIAASRDGALDALSAQASRLGEALERLGFRDPQVRLGLELGSRQESAAGGKEEGGTLHPPATERRGGDGPPRASHRAPARAARTNRLDITI